MKNNITLVELLIVLILIGILSMVVVPVKQQNFEPPSTQQMYIVKVISQPESEVNVK
ncbi:hypothetical protein [Wohlfahrtiimonas populi]|uniref:hypothetical protein n=1 Tax=Wohlfahrtiimonas populi TaxID=1940240 RepID=UPI0013016C50|nr:hypothetical protein [Wohlfahrtiimonas populi]